MQSNEQSKNQNNILPISNDIEKRRIRALHRYNILDTDYDDDFDGMTRLLAKLFGVPMAVVTLVDEDRQWFKSRYGLNQAQTRRDISFCTYTIESEDVLEVTDAALDDRFKACPLVTGEPKIRFYAGAPLVTSDGFKIGSVAVLDTEPRASITEDQRSILVEFADMAMQLIESRAVTYGFQKEVSERIDFQAKFIASESKLSTFVSYMPMRTALFDNNMCYLAASRRWLEDYELDAKKFEGQDHYELMPQTLPSWSKRFIECLSGKFLSKDEEFTSLDGGPGEWISWKMHPLRRDNGTTAGLVLYIESIEKTKQASIELERSTEFLNTVLENMEDGVAVCDPEGNLTLFNDSARTLLGQGHHNLPASEWTNKFELYNSDGKTPMPLEKLPLYRALQGEVVRNQEVIVINHINGSPRHLRASGRSMISKNGEKLGAVVSMHDMTDTKEANVAHRQSENLFRAAFEFANHGMAIIDTTGKWLKVNPALCRITGYTEAELLASSFQSITHPDDTGFDLDMITSLVNGVVNSYELEKRYMHKDGHAVPIQANVSLVRDENGKPLHFVSQTIDLSTHKEAESQLRQSQKLEALGHLTGGIAHDFNNLLTVLQGNLDLASRYTDDNPKLNRYLTTARGAIRSASKLTSRLLAFSRNQQLTPEPVQTVKFLDDVHELVLRTLGAYVDLESHAPDDVWYTLADHNQLESTLINLAINARDAMPQGGKLTISARNVELDATKAKSYDSIPAGDYVCISVSDTGTGVPKAIQEKIFQPFFTTKESGKGTGLGLSMIYGFMKQSNGHIKLYSEDGVGSTFNLYLPRAKSVELAGPAVENAATGPVEGKILVVDDDDLVREVAVASLELLGYDIIEANSAKSALEMIKQHDDLDLVFTDIVMPGGMHGPEFAEVVIALRPDMKVLFTSGFAQRGIERQGATDFGKRFLAKPYRRHDLAEKVGDILAGRI